MGLFDSMRRASARRKATGALGAFYAEPLRDDRYLAVDIETTGLDPSTDRLLSIGWVPVDGDEGTLLAPEPEAAEQPAAPAPAGAEEENFSQGRPASQPAACSFNRAAARASSSAAGA